MKKLLLLASIATLFVSGAFAQSGTTAPTSTVSVTVGPEAGLTIGTSNALLTSTGTNFADYTGTTNFTYFIRTSGTSGSGAITLKVSSDFSGTGGPSVATPPTAGDALTYAATVAAPATQATGAVTASTSAATSVATFGAGAHSAKAGNGGSTAWDLTNDPAYATGSYSATVTWTISAA
jgi:hypothetical protein